jgi:hypothetical protein
VLALERLPLHQRVFDIDRFSAKRSNPASRQSLNLVGEMRAIPALPSEQERFVAALGALAQSEQRALNTRFEGRRWLLRSDPLVQTETIAKGVQGAHNAPKPTLPERHARCRIALCKQR